MTNAFTPEETAFYRALLDKFPGEKHIKSDTEADVLCPAHDDHNPSLGVDLRQNGAGPKLVFNCRSRGCSFEDIREAAGLEASDYTFSKNGSRDISGCTLQEYAAAKNLPVDFLTGDEIRLKDCKWWDVNAVCIPYPDTDGKILVYRYRVALTGKTKVVSKKGDKVYLYGLHCIEEARKAGYVLLVEGESDCHTLWYHGFPAIGVPGSKNWRDEWAEYLDGIDHILVCVEPDAAGEQMFSRLVACTRLYPRLEKVRFTDAV